MKSKRFFTNYFNVLYRETEDGTLQAWDKDKWYTLRSQRKLDNDLELSIEEVKVLYPSIYPLLDVNPPDITPNNILTI